MLVSACTACVALYDGGDLDEDVLGGAEVGGCAL